MANVQQILNDMGNFESIFDTVHVDATPRINQFDHIWEWNPVNGKPIIPATQWERYVPETLANDLQRSVYGSTFINGMRANQQNFQVDVTGYAKTYDCKRDLLSKILRADFKKLRVESNVARILDFTKTTANLLPFDPQNPELPIMTTIDGVRKNVEVLMTEINENARRGYLGTGTFSCRDPHCTITTPCLTKSSVVEWAPNQTININKRFLCNANNVVYLVHCARCLANGLWSVYIGQSEHETTNDNLHTRIGNHATHFNRRDLEKYFRCDDPPGSYDPDLFAGQVSEVMQGLVPDTHQLLRDPYTHFNYVHTRADRRVTVINGGFPNANIRVHHETISKYKIGNYRYDLTTMSGALHLY